MAGSEPAVSKPEASRQVMPGGVEPFGHRTSACRELEPSWRAQVIGTIKPNTALLRPR